MSNFILPQPVQGSRGEAQWRRDEVDTCVAADIADHNGIENRAKRAAEKFDLANDVVNMAQAEFSRAIDRLVDTEKRLGDASKRVSGTIRKAADDLRGGLEKVQKSANFSALEKQVDLLERAASALSSLAELEKDGRLGRILNAIK